MNNFEQHIKDQMQNFAPTPPPAAWVGVSSGLGSSATIKVGAKLLAKWVAGILITGSLVATAVIYTQSDSEQQHIVTQNNSIATSPEKNTKANENNAANADGHNINQNIPSKNNNASSKLKQNTAIQGNENGSDGVGNLQMPPNELSVTQRNQVSNENKMNNLQLPRNVTPTVSPVKIDLSDNTVCPNQVLTATLQNWNGARINWGDGLEEVVNSSEIKHSYSREATYKVSVKGNSEMVTVRKPVFIIGSSFINSSTVLYKINNPDKLELNVQFSDGSSELVSKKEFTHKFTSVASDAGQMNATFLTNSFCHTSSEINLKTPVYISEINNTFSPDNDGINDTYLTLLKDIPLKFYHLEIIDAKGQTVFESYKPTEGWDGTYNNMPMPAGPNYTIQLVYQFEQFTHPEPIVKQSLNLFRK
ncbi:MAG: gliding motility-associated C-terminal domain-containing protein [Bacteroidota bacterium]|nr:gliding motility-associated C-terminal domain-containing protein [Bacteroidota bacterium]